MAKLQELELILADHRRWLETDKQEGKRADLSGADLDGLDLSGVLLSGANLSGASLNGTCLASAQLIHTDLSGASLQGANLRHADLLLANFSGASLCGADLTAAAPEDDNPYVSTRRGPKFREADLTGASLQGAYCYRSDFTGARLNGTDFSRACLSDADLRGADLSDNRLTSAVLINARMQGADLSRADLRDAHMVHADLSNSRLSGADISGASLEAANLADAEVEGICYDRRGRYRGVRVASCYGSSRFRRFAQDQDFIEELKDAHPAYYYLWYVVTDCGRSLLRVFCWSLGLVVLFGLSFYGLGEEAFSVSNRETLGWNLFTVVYYSLVTFTTLGFGDITPRTPLAASLVMMEVVLGYLMLGMLISILADKVARRS